METVPWHHMSTRASLFNSWTVCWRVYSGWQQRIQQKAALQSACTRRRISLPKRQYQRKRFHVSMNDTWVWQSALMLRTPSNPYNTLFSKLMIQQKSLWYHTLVYSPTRIYCTFEQKNIYRNTHEIIDLRITGPMCGESQATGGLPSQTASDVHILWNIL